MNSTLPVRFASDLPPCPCCGEPWCPECRAHYVDCAHPGPHSEEESNPHAVALGALGGKSKSDKKSAASRANGKRGGRPRSL
jgi:hypothetical protein